MFFSEVTGQDEIKKQLILSCREGRVSHALLFFGPKGSGTLPLALAFIQYLTCLQRGESDSCGKCSSCIKQYKLVHPDVHYTFPVAVSKTEKVAKSVDLLAEFRDAVLTNPYLDQNDWSIAATGTEGKQGIIPVEESADIVRMISMKPFESEYKIVLIWMPEKMRADSANKLLKSIEEPPSKTVFVLATEHRDQLLATILSRTQLVKLRRLTDDEIAETVTRHYGIKSEEAMAIARLSDGDVRTAQELAAREQGTVKPDQQFLNWMRLCFSPHKSMDKLLTWVDAMQAEGREGQKQFLFSCLTILRECMLLNSGVNEIVRLEERQQEALGKFRPFINNSNVAEFSQALNEAYFHVERNANAKILFLDLSLKINRILQIR